MAGKHRARKTARRQTEAYALLGTGAITLGLGISLTAGSGVAHAEPTNSEVSGSRHSLSPGNPAGTRTIRTTISAQSLSTSTHSSVPEEDAVAGDEQATSVVTNHDSIVRQMNPAETGDNDTGPAPTLAEQLLGRGQGDSALTSGIPGLDVPFIEFGGGGGGLLSKIAGVLSGGLL